jgi:FAD dependent oxidoreductase TIGR03364
MNGYETSNPPRRAKRGPRRILIVGSGMLGLAHAWMAAKAGYEVVVFERHGRPLGASVRNFGTIWPIGCMPGEEREQALFGAATWREVAAAAGVWHDPCGSLSLAYREEAWAVIREFAVSGNRAGLELLGRDEVLARFPAVNPAGLRGALRSSDELLLHTPTAIPSLVEFLRGQGVVFRYDTPVVEVGADFIVDTRGERHRFDHLLIAAGEEMRLLFPEDLAAADIQPCRLQMMRTVPQPDDWKLGAILVSDLTLCHYPAFRDCPSIGALRERLQAELPEHHRWGVHVIAAQHGDGSLTLGDSHEYGHDLEPGSRDDVDQLILSALGGFLELPDPRIAARWQGTYLKSTRGVTQVVVKPRERVTMITAMGGLGMTLGWGRAKAAVEEWQALDS